MTAADLLARNWWAVVLLAVALRAALAWQRELTWPEYRTLHGIKRLLFSVLDGRERFAVVSWVNDKGGTEDAEYLTTDPESYRQVAKRLRRAGGALHLIASLKRRPPGRGDRLTAAHVTFIHTDGDQTEAYLFANADGSTDVYAHKEPSPANPLRHLGGSEQEDGDPAGVVRDALADA